MKKITFKLFAIFTLLIASFTFAQTTVSITSINGKTPATWESEDTPLTPGDTMDVELTYSNVAAGTDNILVRLLNTWSFIPGTDVYATVTESATPQTVTLQITVPNLGTSTMRIQGRAQNGSGLTNTTYGGDLVINGITAASASITTINGDDVSTYHTNNSGALIEGDVLTIGVDYTAIKPNPSRSDAVELRFRILTNGYGGIPEFTDVYTTVTESDSEQSTTFNITVPNLDATLAGVRLQIIAYGFNGTENANNFAYASNTFDIDHTTLSYNKAKLENVTVGSDAITFSAKYLNDEYTIYNITGQASQSGSISSEVSIESLASGVYILTTDKGSLKFVK